MTIRYECNGPDCDKYLGKDEYRLGLNEYLPAADDEPDPDLLPIIELPIIGEADEMHFCSIGCNLAWLISKADETRPE